MRRAGGPTPHTGLNQPKHLAAHQGRPRFAHWIMAPIRHNFGWTLVLLGYLVLLGVFYYVLSDYYYVLSDAMRL